MSPTPSPADLDELVKTRRTIRRFAPEPVPRDSLVALVDAARFAPTGSNRQPLKFLVVDDPALAADIFPLTRWGGLVRPKRTPQEGQRPPAWILVLVDGQVKRKGYESEMGAAVQTILLAAHARGLGTCWIGSVDYKRLRKLLRIPPRYVLGNIIAVGVPGETPLAEPVETDDPGAVPPTHYYLDPTDRLHVPKRPLAHVLFLNAVDAE